MASPPAKAPDARTNFCKPVLDTRTSPRTRWSPPPSAASWKTRKTEMTWPRSVEAAARAQAARPEGTSATNRCHLASSAAT
eukprot:4696223-Alexandrium_andersonii.AAC.1